MLKPDQIPDEAVEAAAKELAYTNGWRNQQGVEVCKPVVKDIIAAAINAWPGVSRLHRDCDKPHVTLPLTHEARNE